MVPTETEITTDTKSTNYPTGKHSANIETGTVTTSETKVSYVPNNFEEVGREHVSRESFDNSIGIVDIIINRKNEKGTVIERINYGKKSSGQKAGEYIIKFSNVMSGNHDYTHKVLIKHPARD